MQTINNPENRKELSRIWLILTAVLLLLPVFAYSQGEKKFIRQGNREYEKNKYAESEISYRRAIDENKESADAVFNSGDALYKQNKFENAGKQFADNHDMNDNSKKKAASLYNLGNSLLMAKKVKESIDAYKGSLRLDPDNMETKYNLAYAQDLLKQQEQKQQQQQKDQQNQDQNKDQQNKQDNQENKDNKNSDNQQQQQDKPQEQQQQQGISKEDAERLLNALANDEKNVQEKVKLAKALKAKTSTIKNW
jgi:Ca-activated chloride channel family protein